MAVFWRSWSLGDLSGGLVIGALALAWAHPPEQAWRGRGAFEGALMIAAVIGLSAAALTADQPLTYLVFPAFIWAALRLGPQGASVAVAVAAAVAACGTASDMGPFVEHSPSDSALNLQLYITLAAITTLCLAAIVSERRRAAQALAESHARVAAAGTLERRRLEAELHDSAQNRLVALQIRMRLTQETAERASSDLAAEMEELIDEADLLVDQLRRIAHGASPPLLSTSGLVDALRAEALHSAIPVLIAAGEIGSSTPDVEVAVYLSCLESIQNAAKHAGRGASVRVELETENEQLAFSIHDTGRGFDRWRTAYGAGLTSVNDRIATIGGHVEIRTHPGRGTTVAGIVPWPPRTA
jgi:signal transduction histidine kinase